MNILICGKQGSGKSETTDQLRKYFSFRGHACCALDYMTPVKQVRDAVYLVTKQYGIPQLAEDLCLERHIVSWGDTRSQGWSWALCLKNQMDSITGRWDELKMFYVGIIEGLPKISDLSLFPDSFKVYLKCDEEVRRGRLLSAGRSFAEGGHPNEIGFNDCAVCDIFNLVVDTENKTPIEVAEAVAHSFYDKLHSGFREDKAT